MGFLLAILLWVADESQKVRPADPPPPSLATRIQLAAAGGDCAGAQVVVRGPVRALTATSRVPGLDVHLSRVATLWLEHPSGPEGATGDWPDPLIPVRDVLYGEPRRAFPVDVPPNRAQAIFVEACVPRGTKRGITAGSVRVTWQGGAQDVPIEVRARGFDLPATPALGTAFGFSGYSAAKGHRRGPEANQELTQAYDRMALRRGITLFGGTQDPPPFQILGDEVRIVDWKPYDDEVGPFLDGTALPSGARWTSVELRTPVKLTRPQRKAWRRAWVEHFRARGWLDRLFVYVQDEPEDKQLGEVERKAREVLDDAPEVRRLVTTAWTPDLPSVDFWVPLLNCLGEKTLTCRRSSPREKYPRLWWYQSCMSHGCNNDKPTTHPAFRGWPSYMIDAPATASRAMGALAFATGVTGELYFAVNFAYDLADPWRSQWAFGGNGDGTLYYPGRPDAIGGTHHVPVESLRVVQIARSIADYGYLALCARLGDARLAQEEARALAPSLQGWARDPKAYAAMRERVSARIEALLAARKASAE